MVGKNQRTYQTFLWERNECLETVRKFKQSIVDRKGPLTDTISWDVEEAIIADWTFYYYDKLVGDWEEGKDMLPILEDLVRDLTQRIMLGWDWDTRSSNPFAGPLGVCRAKAESKVLSRLQHAIASLTADLSDSL